jgi:hypothetical protein
MINSWKKLIYSIDQMRQLQKNPKAKSLPTLVFQLAQLERDVDECVAKKIAEYESKEQPELPEASNG